MNEGASVKRLCNALYMNSGNTLYCKIPHCLSLLTNWINEVEGRNVWLLNDAAALEFNLLNYQYFLIHYFVHSGFR